MALISSFTSFDMAANPRAARPRVVSGYHTRYRPPRPDLQEPLLSWTHRVVVFTTRFLLFFFLSRNECCDAAILRYLIFFGLVFTKEEE